MDSDSFAKVLVVIIMIIVATMFVIVIPVLIGVGLFLGTGMLLEKLEIENTFVYAIAYIIMLLFIFKINTLWRAYEF
tara:strand:+ start:265 stop:495 length:231 start_codon:yes stop_codon:yes gene_type:complete